MTSGFAIVWAERGLLLSGLANTVMLSLLAGVCALVFGALLSTVLTRPRGLLMRSASVVVDTMRCTPFLLFAYIIYYGLPSLGLRFDNWEAGVVALAIYHTAYMGEVLRAAWLAQPREPIEAGHAFGYSGLQLFRRIIFPPLALASAPVIGNQAVQIIKDSAFLTIIAIPELTHAASSIQSRHFVPFAAFITAVLLYWLLCLVIDAGVSSIGRMAEARR